MKDRKKYQEIKNYWEKCTPMSFTAEKWSYEEKRKFRYDLQDYMSESFRFADWRGKEVLEVGCGSGVDALEFARNGAIVTATDMTDNSVKLTRALAEEAGLHVKVVQTSALELPFPDNSFDCVYSFGVLHHIPDVDTALMEIHRVLRPGGTVMAMLYYRNSLLYAYSIAFRHGIQDGLLLKKGYTEQELVSRYSERIEGCPYTRVYDREEAAALFGRCFEDMDITVRYNVIDTDQQRKVKLGLEDKWELGWHLIVKAHNKTA
jgi:ubiquinone/menaquinone biosynthesis C-methylase UbiE